MMLSQLCRAKLFRTTNFKTEHRSAASSCRSCHGCPATEGDREETRCHLIQCSYCNSRDLICSQDPCNGVDCSDDSSLTQSNSFQNTENPAYGLCAKHWVECEFVETEVGETNRLKDDEQAKVEKDPSNTMTHVNIPTGCMLESIPECKEITLEQSSVHQAQEKYSNFRNRIDEITMSDIAENLEDFQKCAKYVKDLNICDLPFANCDEDINTLNNQANDAIQSNKRKHVTKDKAFPLPVMKPHFKECDPKYSDSQPNSFQPIIKHEMNRVKKFSNSAKDTYAFVNNHLRSSDVLGHEKLSEISSVNTEESIHEWLKRISDWVDNNSWIKQEDLLSENTFSSEDDSTFFNKPSEVEATSQSQSNENHLQSDMENIFDNLISGTSAVSALSKATKESPTNIPMVVMQCSRLHSHITSKPPFQQTSLPMGTLVTALYQESDWLYVQTPHGVEGFVTSSNCVPIGTVHGSNESKRPWEPCDFPIQMRIRNTCGFGHLHGAFVPATLPSVGGKKPGPFVSMVKMKTNLYNDRYFNNTFKLKDSIKTAKTVTDILRSSPEIEVNKQ